MESLLCFFLLSLGVVLTVGQMTATVCLGVGNACRTQQGYLGSCSATLSCVPSGASVVSAFMGNEARIPSSQLWSPGTTATSDWGPPLLNPALAPESQRTLTYFWAARGTTHPSLIAQDLELWLSTNLNGVTVPWNVKLEAPWLEVSTTASPACAPNCRCNVDPSMGYGIAVNYSYSGLAKILTCAAAPTIGANVISCTVPVATYFAHSPIPYQHPYLRTYRKICIRDANAQAQDPWIDTNLWFAVKHSCDNAQNNGNPTLDYSCLNVPNPPTGAVLATNFDGSTPAAIQNTLGAFFDVNGNLPTDPQPASVPLQSGVNDFGETSAMQHDRWTWTTCCGAAPQVTVAGPPASVQVPRWGICINSNLRSCCGWRPYSPPYEKCCSKSSAQISWTDATCSCTSTTAQNDCQRDGPNSFALLTDDRGETDPINTANQCCSITSYPELLTGPNNVAIPRSGLCYNVNQGNCCATDGYIYDKGSQQCCQINGVQSINTPCPCNMDTQCGTGKRCCVQAFPPPYSPNKYPNATSTVTAGNQCNVYANYPTGKGNNALCFGVCYSTAFQICCNGQVCVREYDKCCNATCCNRHTSSCLVGALPPASRNNALNLNIPYEICSEIENLTARRTLFVFAFPVMFLLATLISLSMVVILARRATEHFFDLTEQAIVVFATGITFLACAYYFSPVYKYGIVITFVGIFAILTAVIRRLLWSLTLVLVIIVLLLFLVDPFAGNIYLSFPSGVPPTGGPTTLETPLSHGLFEAIARLILNEEAACTGFYDWFRYDPAARDIVRTHNPQKMTFGYCTRAWLTTLLIFTIFIVLFTLILLSLSIMSFVKKLAPPAGDDVIQLEVKRGSDVYAD